MPPLRATASLSLLVLAIGVAGTAWLSAKTDDWAGPVRLAAVAPPATPHAPHRTRGHVQRGRARLAAVRTASRPPVRPPASMRMGLPARPLRGTIAEPAAPPIAAARVPADGMAELVPLATPAAPVSYAAMRGHLSGSLVLRLWVDGAGQVADAQVAASSGDPVLDAHALASVRRWHFAVPADRPDGITGELPMRFDEPGERLARGP